MATPERKSLLSASAAGAAALVLMQMLSRLLTFVMNQLLVQYLSPSTLGVSALLELYMMTVLHFSRESLRMALQRQTDTGEIGVEEKQNLEKTANQSQKSQNTVYEGTSAGQSQTVVNLSYLAVPIGIVVAISLQSFYFSISNAEAKIEPYFYTSVLLFTIGTVIELLSEPGFALAQQRFLYTLRASCESTSIIASSIVTFAITVYGARYGGLGTLPFAVGQFIGAIVLFVGYLIRLAKITNGQNLSLLPKRIHKRGTEESYILHLPTLSLAGTMWLQSVVKHVLSQGDSILVQWFASSHDQGIYALAANYGSLIARLLFRPLEETSRNLFANLLSTKSDESKHDKTITKPRPDNIRQSVTILNLILRFYALLSLLIITLVSPMAPLALRVVAGARWANSPAAQTLSSYCYYIPLLAINGILEAFVQAVATSSQLRVQSLWMFGFSIAFGAAAFTFVKAFDKGADGLVWANCVNMGLRIIWSTQFMARYFRTMGDGKVEFVWKDMLPSTLLISIAVGAGGIARSIIGNEKALEDYVKAAGIAGVVLAVGAYSERQYFIESYRLFSSARKSSISQVVTEIAGYGLHEEQWIN